MSLSSDLLWGAAGVVLLVALYLWYATIVRRANKVREALASIDAHLRQRHDLIPNLVKLAGRFMEHERGLIEEVTRLRARADTAVAGGMATAGERFAAENALAQATGRLLVTASNDMSLRLWDIPSGRPLGPPLSGHTDSVKCVAVSPDGRRIVSGAWDNTLRLWDPVTRRPIGRPLTGHRALVRSVAFSADGRRIVSSSDDGTLRLFDRVDDAGQCGVVGSGRDTELQDAGFVDRAGEYRVAGRLVNRDAFASDRRLIDRTGSCRHLTIERYPGAGFDPNAGLQLYLCGWYFQPRAISLPNFRRLRRQVEQALDGVTRPIHGTGFDQFGNGIQGHDHRPHRI